MKPDPRFRRQPAVFWAYVRTISERLKYTNRKTKEIKVFSIEDIRTAFEKLGLSCDGLIADNSNPTPLASTLMDYFEFRANVINNQVRPNLMTKEEVRSEFQRIKSVVKPTWPVPLNKQRGKKKGPAYLTAIVNMLIEQNCAGVTCNVNPQQLTTFTRAKKPVRTLARRLDGAFPEITNPIAVWEIKEYYNTKTFGSRVADGVYESLLDGMEIEEMRSREGIEVFHYLILDDHFTWWVKGRSYLCRLIDMLHMGYVDEILFGREVLIRIPELVRFWVEEHERLTLAKS